MASHLKNCAAISYPRRGDFLRRLLRRVFPRRADLLCLFSSRAMLRKARKAVMSKQPELLYISLDAMFFPLLYHAEAAFRRLRGVLSCVLIQTALRSRHSLFARNLLMQPFTGLPATVVITLGLSLVGSISSLLSWPTGNCPAFPKLTSGYIRHRSLHRGRSWRVLRFGYHKEIVV